jgi:hypothetical protein
MKKTIISLLSVAVVIVMLVPAVSLGAHSVHVQYTLEGYTLLPHGDWTTGDVKGYGNGDCVPFRYTVENKGTDPVSLNLTLEFDHKAGDGTIGIVDFESFDIPAGSVTGPTVDGTGYYYWGVTIPVGETYTLQWCARLSNEAADWPGAKTHVSAGGRDVSIQIKGSAAAATMDLTPSSATNLLPGDTSHSFTVTVKDQYGDPMAGQVVSLSTTFGTLSTDQVITGEDGTAAFSITSTSPGTAIITATLGDLSDTATKVWTLAPPVATTLELTPPSATNLLPGDPSHNFTVIVNDQYGSPLAGQNVTLSTTFGTLSTGQVTTAGDGTATFTISSTVVGNATIRATLGNLSTASTKIWTLVPPVAATLELTPPSATNVLPGDTSHEFTVTMKDQYGSGMAGQNVTLSTTFGTLSTGDVTTAEDGSATFTISSTVVGDATITATLGKLTDSATKIWISAVGPAGGSAGCPTTRSLTVDWEGNNTTKPLYSNGKLALDLLGPSPDLINSLLLERGTHAPVVGGTTYHLITIDKLEQYPALPENTQAITVYSVTPTGAVFDKDIFLTLGLTEAQLPANAVNVTMYYYDDVTNIWVPLSSEAGGGNGAAALTLSAPITHFSIYGVLAQVDAIQPAHFVASGLDIEKEVQRTWQPITFLTSTGKTVTISANVFNDGYQQGTYDISLKLNGQTVDTKTVTLSAGQGTQVKFTKSGLAHGQYHVQVAGLTSQFTTSQTITWWLIVLIAVALGLIIWGAFRRTRKHRAHQAQ